MSEEFSPLRILPYRSGKDVPVLPVLNVCVLRILPYRSGKNRSGKIAVFLFDSDLIDN